MMDLISENMIQIICYGPHPVEAKKIIKTALEKALNKRANKPQQCGNYLLF